MNRRPLTPFLERLANDVRKHYALTNIDIKIVSDRAMKNVLNTVGAFAWNVILFSDGLFKKSRSLQTTVLVHEFGHRIYFPETRAKQEVYCITAELSGIPKQSTGRFLNIIGDLMINRANLYDIWHKRMYRGLKESYFSPKEKRTVYNDYTFFLNILNASLQEYRGYKLPAQTALEEEAYRLLFGDARPIKDRVKDLAILLKLLFQLPSPPQGSRRCRMPLPGDEAPFSDPLNDDDMKEIAKELEGLFSDSENKLMDKIKENKKLLRELRRRRALGLALPRIESSSVNLKTRTPSGMWAPGQSVNDLDIRSSITSFGRIIPGETTLGIKTVDGAICVDGTGCQMTMLLDVSSSMKTNGRVERMIDAAVALNRAAKKNNYSVSIITFGERARMIQKPTLDHAAAEEKIFGIEADEDDTKIYPALQLIKSSSRKPLVYILTDAGIYDIIERNVAESIRKITGEGKGILFLIGNDELDDETKKTFKEMKIQAYLVPDNEDYTGAIVKSVLQ
ncbi:MAG: VWA domain-containing protein (plasmid) [Candidatus Methanoperedens sp.]|nr:MAG: VWA domain-containing protein [Candidatus Methanoperedens sp.]